MVFHYFDGFGPKWIALVIAGGGTLASAATYLYRGGGKSYFDEMGTQDSESVLASTTKSMQKKVKEVPQGTSGKLFGSSTSASTSESSDSSDHSSSSANAAAAPPSQFNYRDVANNKLSNLSDKADQAAHSFGDTVQAAVAWVAENPKTTLAFVFLCYAVQHLGRKVLAHEHYEDRLVAEKRVSQRPLDSGSATATTTTNTYDDLVDESMTSSSSAEYRNHNHNNNHGVPSALASNADYSINSNNNDEDYQDSNNYRKNDFPVSTWASRERPSHADPAYEKLLKEELSKEMLEEFTLYLLPSMDVTGADNDLVDRVRNELLSIAPAAGWKAEIREEQIFRATTTTSEDASKSSSPVKNSNTNDDGDATLAENSTSGMNSTGTVIKTKVFRFVDRHGEVKPVHSDAEFSLELLQKEASRRETKKINAKFNVTDS